MLNTPFPDWPSFTQEEADAVSATLLSNRVNYWTGMQCREFECEYAAWAGIPYAIAVGNGTVALEAPLRALGLRPGDEVIVTPRSFLASVSSVITEGGVPVFADVDRETQNLSAETIAPHITARTRAIVLVHLAGMPADMDPILDLTKSRGIAIIEDCAQANGAKYKGKNVGTFGDVGAWSFCQDKIITTGGEGGMITTHNEELWNAMWSYKDHGKSHRAVYKDKHPPGFRWVHESIGINGRMTEMQAAVGRIQLKRLPEWSAQRRANAERIWDTARSLPGLRVASVPDWAEHAAYKCYVFVEPEALRASWSRDRILAEISAAGVPSYAGSCSEIYLEKAFDGTPYRPAQRLPVAKELGETSLMFLVHPTLGEEHIAKTCNVLSQVMRSAVK